MAQRKALSSMESLVFRQKIDDDMKASDLMCARALKFALIATILLPIVGQLLSIGQIISSFKSYKKASKRGIFLLCFTILINIAYIAGVLILFSLRPDEIPSY